MDAFLRRVIEQRQREDLERIQHGRVTAPPDPDEQDVEVPDEGGQSQAKVLDLCDLCPELRADDLIGEFGWTRNRSTVALGRALRAGFLERITPGVYRRVQRAH